MNSVIISDYGVTLGKTGDRLVVRGPKPKLELIEGGPQLFLPLGHQNALRSTVSFGWEKLRATTSPVRPGQQRRQPPKLSADQIEIPLFRVAEIVIGSPGVSISADLDRGLLRAWYSPLISYPSAAGLRDALLADAHRHRAHPPRTVCRL